MKIHIMAVGTRMPDWVLRGYREYADRMPVQCQMNLIEVPAAKRGKGANLDALAGEEADAVTRRLPDVGSVVALERTGLARTSEDMARSLEEWMRNGDDAAFVIGGPEGLSAQFLAQATAVWSLSSMTFPHGMVRIMIAEQIYRGWSILMRQPYHRGGL